MPKSCAIVPLMKNTYRSVVPAFIVACAFALAGCTVSVPRPELVYETSTVRDLTTFPQNLMIFADRAGRDRQLLPPGKSVELAALYKKRFFAAWNQSRPGKGNVEYMRAMLNRSGVKRGFAENFQPWNSARWSAMRENADIGAMPSLRIPAVTVCHTSLRLLPTERPQLSNPAAPGQSFPFDEAQQTALHVGTPLILLHVTRDGAWYYAESGVACGWVRAMDVAAVDETFRNTWKEATLAVCHDDGIALKDESGHFLAHADIGTVLPLDRQNGESGVLVPARDRNGNAYIARARVSASAFRSMPQPLTPGRVAELGNRMMGQSYGWEGFTAIATALPHYGICLPRSASGFRAIPQRRPGQDNR